MQLSVVIPALNEVERIGAAVSSAWGAGADEVLVVDGGSDDETRDCAARSGARVLVAPRGRGMQLQAGGKAAGGEILLFLHADNRLDPTALQQVRDALAAEGAIWGGLRQRIEAPEWIYRLVETGNAWRLRYLGLPYGDQAMFVDRATWEAAGGFDPVPLMEDLLLSRKLRRSAWPRLLPGPVYVDARRWQRRGVVRQTMLNFRLRSALRRGIPPDQLLRTYESPPA